MPSSDGSAKEFKKKHQTAFLHDARSLLASTGALLVVVSNAGILWLYIQTHNFGGTIVRGRWAFFDDGNIIALISLWAKFIEMLTFLLGEWFVSQLWSRRSLKERGAPLVAFQSIWIFGSPETVFDTCSSFYKGRFKSENGARLWGFGILLLCAIILQFYSSAVTTLAIPTLFDIPIQASYPLFSDAVFMSDPLSGTPCTNYTDNSRDACLADWYVGNAISNIFAFAKMSYDPARKPLASELRPWKPTSKIVGGTRIFGLVCSDNAVIEYMTHLTSSVDAVSATATIPALLPILTIQCAEKEPTKDITIANVGYEVPNKFPSISSGQAAAQITINNMTMILAYPATTPSSNTYCAVNLSIPDSSRANINIYLPLRAAEDEETSDPLVQNELNDDIFSIAPVFQQSIFSFASVWLKGMGIGTTPSQTPIAQLLSNPTFAIKTNISNLLVSTTSLAAEQDHTLFSLEAYTLVMMADAVSQGFPSFIDVGSQKPNIPEDTTASQHFEYTIRNYYIGARSKAKLFACFVLLLNSVFVIVCLCTLALYGWLPDWSDPAVLACTALTAGRLNGNAFVNCTVNTTGEVRDNAWNVSFQMAEGVEEAEGVKEVKEVKEVKGVEGVEGAEGAEEVERGERVEQENPSKKTKSLTFKAAGK